MNVVTTDYITVSEGVQELTIEGEGSSGPGPNADKRWLNLSLVLLWDTWGLFQVEEVVVSFVSSMSADPLASVIEKAKVGPGRVWVPISVLCIGVFFEEVAGAMILAELQTESFKMSTASLHNGDLIW